MKEIKAYIHRDRIADVIEALKGSAHCDFTEDSGCAHFAVHQIQGSLAATDVRERHYSMDLAGEFISEYQLELICEDHYVDELLELIKQAAGIGKSRAGWLFVANIERAVPIS